MTTENQPPTPAPQGYWPPQPMPAQQYAAPPAPAPKRRRDFWLKGPGVIALVVVVGLLLFGVTAAFKAVAPSTADMVDVKVASCDASGNRTATAGIEVTNRSDRTRDVQVVIEYRDGAERRLDTDTAYIRNVPAGRTVLHEESTNLDVVPDGSWSCVVVGVR